MGFFSSSSTSSGSQTGSNNNVSQATEAPNVTNFRNSLYPQMQNQLAEAQRPVYGQSQQAGYLNSLNELANSSIKQLGSTIAGRGGTLNSGAFGSGVSNILQGRMGNIANYNMQTPLMNRQAQFQNTMGALGMANTMAGPALRGSTSNSNSSSNTNSTQSNNPSILSDIGSIAGLAMGIPNFGQMFGGGVQNGGGMGMLPQGQDPFAAGGYGGYGMQQQPMPGSWNAGFDFSKMGTWPGQPTGNAGFP